MTPVLLLAGVACVMLVSAAKNNAKVKKTLAGRSNTRYLPQAISMLVLTAQVSELVKAVEHISLVHIVAALLLLAIWTATKSGAEGELH